MLFLYRSLSTTALDDLEVILMALSSHVHSVVIAGDLNVDLLFHTGYSAAYTWFLSCTTCYGSKSCHCYHELIMCRGEYLTLYSSVIYDSAEVKRLPFRAM